MPVTIPLGKGSRRIEIKDVELALFKEMLIHRVMRSRDVHAFYKTLSATPPHTRSITKRLTRLVDSGVLLRMDEPINDTKPNIRLYYYKLAKRGVAALVETGSIKADEAETIYRQILSLRIPKPHNLAVSSLVNNLQIKLMEKNIKSHHERGSTWVQQNQYELPFVPDWVFSNRRFNVFLEVDSGTESLSMIETKVQRYIDYAAASKENIMVVFSIMDTTVDYGLSADRSKRIVSLKESVPPYQHWPKNLSIYVISADRTPELIIRTFEDIEPLSDTERGYVLENWLEEWKTHCPNISMKPFALSRVYGDTGLKDLEVDLALKVEDRTELRTIGFLYGEEGSVKSYQQIRFNHKRIGRQQERGIPFDELIVIYLDYENLIHDVVGRTFLKAWFTFGDTWHHEEERGRYPLMLKPISIFRKEWVSFE